MYKICLVEDEKDLSSLVKSYLEKENYEVVTCSKGIDAIKMIGEVSLFIIDIMLEDDISGYDVIREIRKNDSYTPVIFTSARDKDIDKILGLELGSDDYITKPYSCKELVLRVNNIIKRCYGEGVNSLITYDSYFIDNNKRVIISNNKEIKLTTLEYDLVLLFIKNINKSFSREQILNSLWGENYFGSDRVVDDLVRRIRKKMPKLRLLTIYGFGYRLS